MQIYQITQTVSGTDLGYYEGETPDDALDAMAQDQSYKNYDALLSVTGETRDTDTLAVVADDSDAAIRAIHGKITAARRAWWESQRARVMAKA